ncbi:hypothetical protein GCM10027290_00270 [Micromonospora sonneratiae]
MFDLDECQRAGLRCDAGGFVLKRSGPALLAEPVRTAVAGDMLTGSRLCGGTRRPPSAPLVRRAPRETDIAHLGAGHRSFVMAVAYAEACPPSFFWKCPSGSRKGSNPRLSTWHMSHVAQAQNLAVRPCF